MLQLTNSYSTSEGGELSTLIPVATEFDTFTKVFPHCLSSTNLSGSKIEVWQLYIPETIERTYNVSPQAVIKNRVIASSK